MELNIPAENIWWANTVMIIRVDSRGVTNTVHGAVTHYRIKVNNEVISEQSVVHQGSNVEQTVVFHGVKTISKGNHNVYVDAKTSAGTTFFAAISSQTKEHSLQGEF